MLIFLKPNVLYEWLLNNNFVFILYAACITYNLILVMLRLK